MQQTHEADDPTSLYRRGAIITGASQGLGRAIAAEFVQAGADVLLVARDAARLIATKREIAANTVRADQRVEAFSADVSDPESATEIAASASKLLPNVTVLVNNAGIYGPMGAIETVSWEEWVAAIRINLFGTVLMCRSVIPLLRAQGYGKIINLSGGGATAPLPFISAYAASKAAVVRLTETFAEELREAHVDVNAIAPGALNTRLLGEVIEAGAEKVGEAFYRKAIAQKDDGGVPMEVGAGLARFLASAASDGITGRLLSAVWDDWANLPTYRSELAASDIFTLRRIVPEDRQKDWSAK